MRRLQRLFVQFLLVWSSSSSFSRACQLGRAQIDARQRLYPCLEGRGYHLKSGASLSSLSSLVSKVILLCQKNIEGDELVVPSMRSGSRIPARPVTLADRKERARCRSTQYERQDIETLHDLKTRCWIRYVYKPTNSSRSRLLCQACHLRQSCRSMRTPEVALIQTKSNHPLVGIDPA